MLKNIVDKIFWAKLNQFFWDNKQKLNQKIVKDLLLKAEELLAQSSMREISFAFMALRFLSLFWSRLKQKSIII